MPIPATLPRHMKRVLSVAALTLSLALLGGCGSQQTVRYRATWEDPARATNLVESIERVIIRRLAALQFLNPAVTVVPENQTSAVVTIETTSPEMKDAVTHILTDPFAFELRVEDGVEATENIEDIQWASTGIDGSMLVWVQALGNRQSMEISLDLQLNEEGQAKLEALTQTHRGKRLGIFVRDILMSMLTIESGSFAEHVLIGGVPSTTIAEIFADDVNVGLRVSFTPF
jgi:preprotein translocase subunit SecD